MRWFSKSWSGPDREAALQVIQHLQTMLAYQQLTMEHTNDAFALATGAATPTYEGLVRPMALLRDPAAVARYIIPAFQRKLDIFAAMEKQHKAFPRPGSKHAATAYDAFIPLLEVLQQRARFQYESYMVWTNDPSIEVHPTALDAVENAALNAFLQRLNKLIEGVGMRVNEEPWLEIVCAAFNSARAYVGLLPLIGPDFRSRYFGGLMGQPARFFRD